jgi:Zn-dependent M28 family amino/carboxypeptidase
MSRLAALILAIATIAAGQAPAARYVDRERLMRDVSTLADRAFEGRATGSTGGIRARQWIAAQFARVGLTPTGTSGFLQPFTASSRNRQLDAANIVGRVAGRAPLKAFVVTAHYDHDGIRNGIVYPGADDNASGVAALLAAASYFVATPPRHPMIFAALDAEEMGRQGARAFVASGIVPRGGIALNVNLDMVSRSATNEMYAAGTYHYPSLTPILEEIAARSAVRILLGHDRPGTDGDDWTNQSDHFEFHKAGVPFIYFGVENHPDYHQPTDTADRIDPRFFGDAADTIVDALRTLDARLP